MPHRIRGISNYLCPFLTHQRPSYGLACSLDMVKWFAFVAATEWLICGVAALFVLGSVPNKD